jgi:hypothetical protein
MPKLDFPMRKISNEELLRHAIEQSPEQASVLIELELPARQVDFRRVGNQGVAHYLPSRVIAETPEQREEVERKTAEARDLLEQVLDAPPHWLSAARAFVADVNGTQLQQIARSPLIKAIRPNRRLREGSSVRHG